MLVCKIKTYSFETAFLIISTLSDKYLGKFVCHIGQAFSTTWPNYIYVNSKQIILIDTRTFQLINHIHASPIFETISSTCAFELNEMI